LRRKKRFKGTFLTEEEFRVLNVLLKYGRVSDAARTLGKAQPTISIVKKRIEEKLKMSLETVKLAINLGLISRSELLDMISIIETHSEPEDFRREWLLNRYFILLNEIIESTIMRTTPGLLELLNIYFTYNETRISTSRILLHDIPSTRIHSQVEKALIR